MNHKLKCLVKRALQAITMRRFILGLAVFGTLCTVTFAEKIENTLFDLYREKIIRIERMNAAHISANTHREAIAVDKAVYRQNKVELDVIQDEIWEIEEEGLEYLPSQSYKGSILEYPRATPTIKNFVRDIIKNDKIVITDICRSSSPSAHKNCAAVDIRLKNLPDRQGALDWLNTFDVECEIHRNMKTGNYDEEWGEVKSGNPIVVGINSGNAHIHCTDKWYLEQKQQKKDEARMKNILFTSYNPVEGQTDATPCIAEGTGMNICEMAGEFQRPIAFSQDLIDWSYQKGHPLSAGMIVNLESTTAPDDIRCNGEFIVADAMNVRYTKRGDVFFMNESDNFGSCRANVTIVK